VEENILVGNYIVFHFSDLNNNDITNIEEGAFNGSEIDYL